MGPGLGSVPAACVCVYNTGLAGGGGEGEGQRHFTVVHAIAHKHEGCSGGAETNHIGAASCSSQARPPTGLRAVTLGASRGTIGGKERKGCMARRPITPQDAASAATWALTRSRACTRTRPGASCSVDAAADLLFAKRESARRRRL